MSSWSGKTRGGVLGYLFFISIIKNTGLNLAYFLLRFATLYYWLFTRKKYLHYYFQQRLGYNYLKSQRYIYRLYYKLGQVLIDKIAVLSGSYKKFTFDFDGESYLRGMKEGGMLIGAHMGNWEIAGQLLEGRLPVKTNILMFDEEHQKIKGLLDDVLVDKSFKIIPVKQDLSHIFELNEVVKKKQLLVMHGDRFIEGNKTAKMKFLGENAKFPLGPFNIALKFNLPVSFVYAMKESKSHYHFYASEPKIYVDENKSSRQLLMQMMQDYINNLEEKVKSYPDQFFNFYDFWGTEKSDE